VSHAHFLRVYASFYFLLSPRNGARVIFPVNVLDSHSSQTTFRFITLAGCNSSFSFVDDEIQCRKSTDEGKESSSIRPPGL